jgi:hypothetical protein
LVGLSRTLVGVFRFVVFVAHALDRAAMTAASALLSSALLSSAGLLALDGVRRCPFPVRFLDPAGKGGAECGRSLGWESARVSRSTPGGGCRRAGSPCWFSGEPVNSC